MGRSNRYRAKVSGDVAKARLEIYGGIQAASFKRAVAGQVKIERLVKSIIERNGIIVTLNHLYMNFGKKIDKIRRKYTGPAAQLEACIEYEKWLARGLDSDTLDEIVVSMGFANCAAAGPYTYDYSSNVGVDRWAYTWTSAVAGLKPDPPPYGVEFTPLQYTQVAASDDQWAATAPANARGSNLFKLQIPILGPAVTKIDWLMEGHVWGSGMLTGHDGYIWNFNTTTWDALFAAVNELADVTHSGSIVAGMANYVDGTGTMYFAHLAKGIFPATTAILYSDYVRFVIHV
jgi:hypothetical protein